MCEQGGHCVSHVICQFATKTVREELEIDAFVRLDAQGLLELEDKDAKSPSDACFSLFVVKGRTPLTRVGHSQGGERSIKPRVQLWSQRTELQMQACPMAMLRTPHRRPGSDRPDSSAQPRSIFGKSFTAAISKQRTFENQTVTHPEIFQKSIKS